MAAGDDLRRFTADLTGPWRKRAVDLAADQVAAQLETAARRAVGGDLTVTGRGRLAVKVTTTPHGATVAATGPWHLVEHPRRGGYPIRPQRKGGALRVGPAMWRATARGGPIHSPLRPFAKGADAAVPLAWDAVARSLDDVVSRA